MLTAFLQCLENPIMPLLGPNYWFLKKTGLILPENKIAKAAYIAAQVVGNIFLITQYIELYVIRSNLDLVLTNLKISMLSTICVVKADTCVFWQTNWRQVIEYVTEADKYEREHSDAVKSNIVAGYTKYSRIVTYFYWSLVFATVITVTHTPLVIYLSSPNFREELHNGTELFPHIYSSWMPFDKYHSPGSWITVMWHAAMTVYGSVVVAAYDTSIIVIMVFFGGKLELLRERCKQMLGSSDNSINNEDAGEMMRQMHEVHVLLIKHLRLFNSLLSPVMFLYVVMCSLMLCASAYQLTSATNTTQKLLMAEYLVFGIAQLFMFCWHSNDVLVKTQNVIFGTYESEWWAADVRQRKSVLILAGQFRINHVFKAGPFSELTLPTFVKILKGAYSYYTLLRK